MTTNPDATRALQTLYQLSQTLKTHAVNPETALSVCQGLVQLPGMVYAGVVRYHGAGTCSILAEYPTHPNQSLAAGLFSNVPENTPGQVFQALAAPAVYKTPEEIRQALEPFYTRLQMPELAALLVIPLRAHDDMVGLLILGKNAEMAAFSPEDIQVAETLAIQITLGMRGTDLSREIQRRSNQLEQTTAFGRVVTSTFDREQILQHVAEILPQLLPCEYIALTLYSAGQSRMRTFELKTGVSSDSTWISSAGTSVEEIVSTQTPTLIGSLASSTFTDHKRLAQRGLNALLAIPLVSSQKPIGGLAIAHAQAQIYTPTDLTLLQQIGTPVAISLENARLFQAARQRAAYEEALGVITSHLQQQTELRVLLEQTMRDLGQVLGAQQARVRLQIVPRGNTGRLEG